MSHNANPAPKPAIQIQEKSPAEPERQVLKTCGKNDRVVRMAANEPVMSVKFGTW